MCSLKKVGYGFCCWIMPNNFQMSIRKIKTNTNRSLKFHCIRKMFPLQKLKIISKHTSLFEILTSLTMANI